MGLYVKKRRHQEKSWCLFYFDLSKSLNCSNFMPFMAGKEENLMEELLSKIYDRIVIYEKDCISLGTEFDQKVAEKLEPMKESISEDELEKLKELIYWAAFLEEKDGFRLGVRFTLKLLMEILLPEEQS